MVTNAKLWDLIRNYDLEKLGHGTFVDKITENYHLTEKYTKKAIDEYKKFIYLTVLPNLESHHQ